MSDKVTRGQAALLEKMWREYAAQFKDEDQEAYKSDLELYLSIRALIEQGPEVDEDWLIAKANAVLYALRRRFRSRITATDTAMMRDLLADVVMAAGIRIKKEG